MGISDRLSAMRWLLAKDLRILRRSPLIALLLVLYPVVIAALVGFAVTSGPAKPRVALVNQIPPGEGSVNLGTGTVDIQHEAKPLFDSIKVVKAANSAEAIRKVRDGDVLGALVVPPNLPAQLQQAVSGNGPPPTLQVYYNAEDPAKQSFVSDTIKARVQDADVALSKQVSKAALSYLDLIASGGQLNFLGANVDVLGLARAATILQSVEASLPANSPQRAQVAQVARFAQLARDNIGLAGPLLKSIGTPIQVQTTVVGDAAPPLGAFAAAVAATATLMFVTVLLAAGALALEREENAFRRLVRGLVTRTTLVVEKVTLSAGCAALVTLALIAILAGFVSLPWSRLPAWLVALAFGALAFGALGVAIGALAREVRAASLLAFMATLPIAVIALIPSGAVSGGLYSLLRVISAAFPFRAALDALDSALGRSGSIGLPLLHLAILAVAFTALARLAVRRF
jgi:ABC-type transport system involved in cytochrome c biogenesis permease component